MTHPLPVASIPLLRPVPGPSESPDLPSYSPVAEDVFLRSVLWNASLVHRYDWLRPEHFFLRARAYLWTAAQAIAARAPAPLPAEPWLHDVALELRRTGRLADVGGITTMARLADELPPDTLDLDAHAETIYACWHQREIERVTVRLAKEARHGAAGPEALLAQLEGGLASLQGLSRAPDEDASLGTAARLAAEQLEARARGDETVRQRFATGFADLDRLSNGGPGRGALWVLGGRPGEGKTALAMNIALNMAFDDVGVGVFSLEMTREELATRVLASESGVSAEGELDADQVRALHDAAARVRRLPVLIDDTPGLALDELLARAKRMKVRLAVAGKRLGLIVVDYLQIVQVPHVAGRKKVDEIGDISKALKVLARELNCAVLALAQLSRESEREKRRPRMTDLRDCGQIEQDADWVGILWRGRHTESWQTDLAICKQRTGQKTADLKLGWQGHLTRFSDG